MSGQRAKLVFAYLLSQYCWLIGVLCVFGIILLIPDKNQVLAVDSATRTFNNSADPTIFGVCADVHVEELQDKHTQAFIKALDFAASMSIDTFVVAGDVVENWKKATLGRIPTQRLDQFKLYKQIVDDHSQAFKYYFDIAGNHDLFSVWSYDSPKHYYRQYSGSLPNLPGHENYSVFRVHSYETPEFAFVMLNPFLFPMTPANVDFWARVDDEMLDAFEAELNKHIDREVIVFTHFPIHWWRNTSNPQRCSRIKDILDKSNAHMVVTGHRHPAQTVPQHHGRALEILASDIIVHQNMGFITFDNGCAVFHTVNLNNELPKGFVTNPVPFEQITKKSVFNEQDLTIRVIAITEDDSIQIDAKIDNKPSGSLKFERVLRPNTSLWTLSTHLPNGKHTLQLSGFMSENVEFFIGEKRESYSEPTYALNFLFIGGPACALFLWIVLIPLLFPFEFDFILKKTNVVNDWLVGHSTESHWLGVTLGSPWMVRSRLQKLPMLLRLLIFIGCLAPLAFPSVFFTVEGHIGFVNIYGFRITGQQFDVWGLVTALVYHLFVTFPSVVLGSAIGFSFPWKNIVILDIVWAFAGTVGSLLFANIFVVQMSDRMRTNLSIFMICPFVIHGSLLVWRILTKRRAADLRLHEESTTADSLGQQFDLFVN